MEIDQISRASPAEVRDRFSPNRNPARLTDSLLLPHEWTVLAQHVPAQCPASVYRCRVFQSGAT